MLNNGQIFPQWVTSSNKISADVGQQKPVERLLLEKKDCNKSKALIFQDKDENGLELSLRLTCGRSQCKSIEAYAQRNMGDSQESPNDVHVTKMGLGASSSSFLEENSFQLFRDGASSQARGTHELVVTKSFLVDDKSEREIHMLTNASSFQGQHFNNKLLEEKEKLFSNGRTQFISCSLGAESWSIGKNNGEEDKSRALWQQSPKIQEGVGWSGHASAPSFKATASTSGRTGSQAGLLPAIDLESRSGTEIGSLSSARKMDVVHSMDVTVPMLLAGFPSHSKGAAQMFASQSSVNDTKTIHLASTSKSSVAQLLEILQQHGIPERHMPRELHLHKQQEARKKRRMLIDEQKQQKKAEEDERSYLFDGKMGTIFGWPGSSECPCSSEVQIGEQTVSSSMAHNVELEQLVEAHLASQQGAEGAVEDAQVRTEENTASAIELQEGQVGATMNYIEKLMGDETVAIQLSNDCLMRLPGSIDDAPLLSTSMEKVEGNNIKNYQLYDFVAEWFHDIKGLHYVGFLKGF